MAGAIHIDDVGVVFEATLLTNNVPFNIAAAVALELWFRRPDGRILKKTASLTTNGTDGKMRYMSRANDLSYPGTWQWQPCVEFSTTTFHGDIQAFTVERNLA